MCPWGGETVDYRKLSSYSRIMVRRRPGSLLPLEVDILESGLTLQATEGSFYGFALAKQLAERDGTALTAHGTLYKALSRMSESGLLHSTWEDAALAAVDGRPRRRLYTVTGEGSLALSRAQAEALARAHSAPSASMPGRPGTVSVGASAR
jgi:PadR family transcriptional regulator PadR